MLCRSWYQNVRQTKIARAQAAMDKFLFTASVVLQVGTVCLGLLTLHVSGVALLLMPSPGCRPQHAT